MTENLVPARPTLMQRINDRLERRRSGESGLALLDVLLGMAIFALIVIIAIQSIGQFRQRAFQTAVTSDAQQASIGLESYFTDNQAYPVAGTAAGNIDTAKTATAGATNTTTLSGMGVNLTKNVSVWSYAPNNAAGTYTMCLVHSPTALGATALAASAVDAWAAYNSSTGAIVASGRGAISAATGTASGGICV